MLSRWMDAVDDDEANERSAATAWSAAPSPVSVVLDDSATWLPFSTTTSSAAATSSFLPSSAAASSTSSPTADRSHHPLSFGSDLLDPPPPASGLGLSFDSLMDLNPLPRKLLGPLERSPAAGAAPTLFQKRCGKRIKREEGVKEEEGLNYGSEEDPQPDKEEGGVSGRNGNNGKTERRGRRNVGGGVPAKNLMAERRRRKKLNDKLYTLRSIVPKITRMDKTSILADAIEYMKELEQRINDINNELGLPPTSSLAAPTATSCHPLTSTLTTLSSRMKEESSPTSLPSSTSQVTKVEVKIREDRAVNIHMSCASRPGVLQSTMRALDVMGLDVQQAVTSCFDGFQLDVFRAEQSKDGREFLPEEIKEVLLHSA